MKKAMLLVSAILLAAFTGCKEESPNAPQNQKPNIISLSAEPSTIRVNQSTTLICDAIDLDGDKLTISWSSQEGLFPDGNVGDTIKWKAPELTGIHSITANVSDGKESEQGTVNVTVTEAITMGNPCPGLLAVTHEGIVYNTVQIGSQCWLKENLNVGVRITGNEDQTNNNVVEKYCYNDLESNCDLYGGLYQWSEAMQYVTTPGSQGICPPGWHIPTIEELELLKAMVDENGNLLKALGEGTGDGTGTNVSGFSALLSGYRDFGGSFKELNLNGFFRSSTEYSANNAYYFSLHSSNSLIDFFTLYKCYGYSVRCIRD